MFVEFYNLSQDKAYYACGCIEDIVALVPAPTTLENLVDCGVDSDMALHRILPAFNRLVDIDAGDSFQIRLFTMEPDSPVLTKRIMIRGIYWPKWSAVAKNFTFEKAN